MLGLILACAEPIQGVVHAADGAPVGGATVRAADCEAVTDADGRFSTFCPEATGGPRTFTVSHPFFIDATADAANPIDIALQPIPVAAGVFVVSGGAIVEIPRVDLARTGDDATGWAFCLPNATGRGVAVPAGDVRLLDNHDVDWKLLAIGDDGCPYRLEHANGEWWTSSTKGIPVTRESELAPGRSWVSVHLEPGRYALMDWFAGGPVPGGGETWRARELDVDHAD